MNEPHEQHETACSGNGQTDLPASVADGLRAVAGRLDRASVAVYPASVRARGRYRPSSALTAKRAPGGRVLLVAAAVALVAVGLSVVVANRGRGEDAIRAGVDDTSTPVDDQPSPSAAEPSAGSAAVAVDVPGYRGAGWNELPAGGWLVVDEAESRVLTYDGVDLGRFPTNETPGLGNDPAQRVDLDVGTQGSGLSLTVRDRVSVDDTGCETIGRGGVRAGVCGGEAQDRLALFGPDGFPQPLIGRALGAPVGRYAWAEPSLDGRWVLGRFSVECEVPIAVLVGASDGATTSLDGHTDLSLAATADAVGWMPDGRAAVYFREDSSCGSAPGFAAGLYAVDPDTLERQLLVADAGVRVLPWERRRVSDNDLERDWNRTAADLAVEAGVETCCGEPSHGGGGLSSGLVIEGAEVAVNATPLERAQPIQGELSEDSDGALPIAIGETDGTPILAFTCGGDQWVLSAFDFGQSNLATESTLRVTFKLLVTRLHCTVGPAPSGR